MFINLIMMLIASTGFIALSMQGLRVIEHHTISNINLHIPKILTWAVALSFMIAYVIEELPIVLWELFR